MCGTCGCSKSGRGVLLGPNARRSGVTNPSELVFQRSEAEEGLLGSGAHASIDSGEVERILLEESLLRANDSLARANREEFCSKELLALNFVSSPGSGKTTLLERIIADLARQRPIVVVQGDQATERDADRIRAAGALAYQVNTGQGCHLDARMVASAVAALNPPRGAFVAIENVGNLVCPAMFDLGELGRVALLSVPEGADKPLKYPYMFRGADLILLNKIDLLPYVDFDRGLFEDCVRKVNVSSPILEISATRGDGLDAFYEWVSAVPASGLRSSGHEEART